MKRSSPTGHPIPILEVIDTLTVGPVRLEPRRVTAPYTVRQGRTEDTFELAFRFEEDVFTPEDPDDLNLAAMMVAQVALNYGMFCREIEFVGPYDKTDQRFLTDMAENTAREIYVKKFLEPNAFLVGPARDLPPVKLKKYSHAELQFQSVDNNDSPKSQSAADNKSWPRGSDRFLILSSGGKDSLLSYGLLHEIGAETHPIYVNESGRHWFTALNAYRHFSEHVPNTGRVWTNADRLFNWMLRKLPFVRQDFANVRSDEYPIRLWTVGVFLFGTLPIAKRRGVRYIIIGDEYDTTERASHEGIPHYSGLFDQSRYFDERLTRYYAAKKWALAQFSLLRPLSELLIEKMLAERYPDLLRLQTSCHATHQDGDRVLPCGKCEKCRRIVAMLKSVGQNPHDVGYNDQQIAECLQAIAKKGAHQEHTGVEHLGYLLTQRGLITENALGDVRAQQRSIVVQLRFDRERSPIECIPSELRRRLYPLMLKTAEGSVKKIGTQWQPFDPLAVDALARPYPFEQTIMPNKPKTDTGSKHSNDFVLGEMTWPEAESRFKEVDVALLPVGAIEQHGHHLPLDTDAFDAQHLAMEVAAGCSKPQPLVLPLIPYGVSYHHDDFKGTISVSNETLSRLVYEIGMALARNGITKLVIINGHGGNAATLNFAAQMINRDSHIFTCVDTGETSDHDIDKIIETPSDIHAGETETSTSLSTRPHLVDMSKAKKGVLKFSSRYLDFSSNRGIEWYARTSKISKSGVMGDPTKATKEKGDRIWAVMVKNLVEFIEHLKSMTLDEIHQRNRF